MHHASYCIAEVGLLDKTGVPRRYKLGRNSSWLDLVGVRVKGRVRSNSFCKQKG